MKVGDLIRVSNPLRGQMHHRIGLITQRGVEPTPVAGVSFTTRKQDWWVCSFGGETRVISEHCLELVQ